MKSFGHIHLVPLTAGLPGVTAVLASALVAGCGDESASKPMSYERSERALRDPMHYEPDFGKPLLKRDPSVPDAKDQEKDGLGKDLDHVFNP